MGGWVVGWSGGWVVGWLDKMKIRLISAEFSLAGALAELGNTHAQVSWYLFGSVRWNYIFF